MESVRRLRCIPFTVKDMAVSEFGVLRVIGMLGKVALANEDTWTRVECQRDDGLPGWRGMFVK